METSGGIRASLAGRYASALFDLARDEQTIDSVSSSVGTIKRALGESSDLAKLIASPLVSREDSGKALAALAGTLALDPITTNFLGVLARNGRKKDLKAVIDAFNRLAADHRGETVASVVTAHPLGADQVNDLKAKLRARAGREVAIDASVDPQILGGLIVQLGSQQIDASIRTKLNRLATAMKG